MNKICLIDGSAYIFRAFHALPPLSTPDGFPVNAVYGFTKSMMQLQKEHDIKYFAVIFDSSSKNFRNDIYKEYKAHRPRPPEDLIKQFPIMREAVKALNIVSVEQAGYEADDIIATYSKQASEEGIEVCILSSDKDLMQLVSDKHNVYMIDPIKKKKITEKNVIEKFGVTPNLVTDAQALIGDSADNVPGVRGIGPKTASDLINTYGSLEKLLENIENIEKKSVKTKLLSEKENAIVSKKLVELDINVPDIPPVKNLEKQNVQPEVLCDFLQKMSFTSLAHSISCEYNIELAPNSYFTDSSKKTTSEESNTENVIQKEINIEITNEKDLNDAITNLLEAYYISIYMDSFINDYGFVSIFNIHTNTNFNIKVSESLNKSIILQKLKPLLEKQSVKKIIYNHHGLYNLCSNLEINPCSVEDISLLYYLCYGSVAENTTKGLNQILMKLFLYREEFEVSEEEYDIPGSAIYTAYEMLIKKVVSQTNYNLYNIDKNLSTILYDVHKVGITVNEDKLKELSQLFLTQVESLEEKIYAIAGEKFNIGSPKQLGEVLFEKLKYKGKKNKNKSWKTDISILEELKENNIEIAELIIHWRQLVKLRNTYTDSLVKKISSDNKIHTQFLQCVASTGRLSSIEPNLQNIPIRTNEGKQIRKAFVSSEGKSLISLDYSQVELRVLAKLANVKNLITAFEEGKDIHQQTASEIFNVPMQDVNSDLRRKAKAINFGIIYGQTEYGLASSIGISKIDASTYIQQYFETYPEIKKYMNDTIEFAKNSGYVETQMGRRIFVDNINSSNFMLRSLAERAAINAPIQGTAADIMRISMIEVGKFLKNTKDANIILQIHDELIIECLESEANSLALECKDLMEKSYDRISLKVDFETGKSWYDL